MPSCGYAAVGVSGSQKGDNFLVMDRVFVGPFDVTAFGHFLWAEEPEQWIGNGRLFFSSLVSLAFRTRFALLGLEINVLDN